MIFVSLSMSSKSLIFTVFLVFLGRCMGWDSMALILKL